MATNWTPQKDIPDLSGKIALVTGASSGIGLHTAKHLALHGAKVYFTARTEEKANKARQAWQSESPAPPTGSLHWLPLELGSVASVMKAAEELRKKEQKLDILIHNAGLATKTLELTEDGWEAALEVSLIGPFILTNQLLPLLKNAANQKQSDVRIITVSSSGQYQFFPADYKFEFSEPDFLVGKIPYEPEEYRNQMKEMLDIDGLRYAMSKVAMTLFSQELQSHLDKAGLQMTSISLNPGGVRTEAAVAIWDPSMRETMRQQMAGEDEGSYTSLFAATSPEVYLKPQSYKGKYLEPVGEIKDPHAVSKDQSQCRSLWDTTEQEVSKFLLKSGFPALNKWL